MWRGEKVAGRRREVANGHWAAPEYEHDDPPRVRDSSPYVMVDSSEADTGGHAEHAVAGGPVTPEGGPLVDVVIEPVGAMLPAEATGFAEQVETGSRL